jgi:hypothetical protein
MGLKPVIWTRVSPTSTFDTDDFNIAGGLVSASQVINNFDQILGNASAIDTGFIVLEHDLFQQTVEVATGYILPQALAHQPPFKLQPVVECQHLNLADAYIETNNNSTNPPPVTPGASTTNSNSNTNSQTASPTGSGSGSGSGGSGGNGNGGAQGGNNAAMSIRAGSSSGVLSALMTGAGGVLAGLGLLML